MDQAGGACDWPLPLCCFDSDIDSNLQTGSEPTPSLVGYYLGGDPYRQGGTGPVAPAFAEAPGQVPPAPVPPVGTQPGFVDDGVDDPDTAVGYPDEEFAAGRPTQDGPGLR